MVSDDVRLICGDALDVLRTLEPGSVQTCVTSPPYFALRDYGVAGQIGLEPTPDEYVARLVAVFAEVRRVLRDDGTCWVNLGDSYCQTDKWGGGRGGNSGKHTVDEGGAVPSWACRKRKPTINGVKPKDLLGIPWGVAFALRADGWHLRQDIIWAKPNPMPESVRDRCTKAHEYIFLLSKKAKYYYDAEAIGEAAICPGDQGFLRGPVEGCDSETVAWRAKSQQTRKLAGVDSRTAGGKTRNRRSVWTVSTEPYAGAHFATFPTALIEPCILAGCPEGGVVLDPFAGSCTTGYVALKFGRRFVGIELNPAYITLGQKRLDEARSLTPLFDGIPAYNESPGLFDAEDA